MAKWFAMPEGVDSISLQQLEFHPRVVQNGVRCFSVPNHLADELMALNIRTGTESNGRPTFARFGEVKRPEGVEDEPEMPTGGDAVALGGQIMTLQVQNEGLRAQIAELMVERDELRLRVAELEAKIGTKDIDDETMASMPVGVGEGKRGSKGTNRTLGAGPHLTDSPPAEALLDQLSGMTLGKD